jgi:hypothetical protein
MSFKVILHKFWVKKCFPWKFNLEYDGIFTKLFIHVSSRNMFPTIRNLQIRVHAYLPRHCCGDWLTFGCFVPMIADHDLVTKRWMLRKARTHSWQWLLRNLSGSCRVNQFVLQLFLCGTHGIYIFFHQLDIAHER